MLRAVFSQNHAILASPAGAGERSTSANHTSFYSCSWDVFPYDLFPVQLCPMGLLLGQVSKWRAQRADRGAHAARGFVGGATPAVPWGCSQPHVSMPHAALWVVQRPGANLFAQMDTSFNAARGFVGGAARIRDALRMISECFNAARGFVGGAAMRERSYMQITRGFQCRTRLCGWCSENKTDYGAPIGLFQCRTRLCEWCSSIACVREGS